MTAADYAFLVRNPRTLEVIGEIPPQHVASARWARLFVEPGTWQLQIARAAAEELAAAAGVDLIARQNLLEIRRDEAVEFRGYILTRQLDPQGLVWTLEGYDLKDWLRRRVVGRTTAVAKSGAAETVLKAYVEENLGATAGTGRVATDELSAKTFTIETDAARGESVEISAQRRTLDQVAADICRQGDIGYDVELTDDGLRFVVIEPTDATSGSGGTPFAVNLDNVEGLGWRESYGNVQNALTVGGEGSGDTRTVREVSDAASIASDFRREGVLDARALTTNDQLDALGAAEIARQLAAAVAADVVPLTTSANGRYRTDWDLAWDVTVAIPAAGVAAIDRRIAAVTVTLTREAGERITFALGTERPTSTLRRIQRVLDRLQAGAAV